MKFGKEFGIHLEETLPEWRDKYLSYKPLKKLLKNIPEPAADNLPPDAALAELHEWFVRTLNEELEKFNDFYVDKEEDFIIRFQEDGDMEFLMTEEATEAIQAFRKDDFEHLTLQLFKLASLFRSFATTGNRTYAYDGTPILELCISCLLALKERIERVKARGSTIGVFTSETEFSEEMMNIREDFVAIHGEMVLLKNYSSLNFAGLIKILKKYDKRTGELLSLPFTQLAVHQPFFTTEPLTRLVHECEANLEVLFPLEAEVVESTPIDQSQTGPTNTSLESRLALGEETVDIYRSTLAAIKAIQGLKKASSTYNPMSLSYLFGNQDNEITGAVTDVNSPSDSLATLHKGDDTTIDVRSPK